MNNPEPTFLMILHTMSGHDLPEIYNYTYDINIMLRTFSPKSHNFTNPVIKKLLSEKKLKYNNRTFVIIDYMIYDGDKQVKKNLTNLKNMLIKDKLTYVLIQSKHMRLGQSDKNFIKMLPKELFRKVHEFL
jgi:hypothetical protein